MKKTNLYIFIVVSICLLVSNSAGAQSRHKYTGDPFISDCSPNNGKRAMIVEIHKQQHQAVLEVLIELTGNQEDALEKKLAYKPIWAVIDDFNIDFATFHSKMEEREYSFLEQAVHDGKLSQSQVDRIKLHRENKPKVGFPAFERGFTKHFPPHSCGGPGRNNEKADFIRSLGEKMFQAAIAEITVLSKQQEATIKEKLDYKPLWAVLDEYSVDFEQFQAVMKNTFRSFINQAVENETITEGQGNRIAERMARTFGYKRKGFPF